jgi:hypothetical protein
MIQLAKNSSKTAPKFIERIAIWLLAKGSHRDHSIHT